jgi:hypothetical protein
MPQMHFLLAILSIASLPCCRPVEGLSTDAFNMAYPVLATEIRHQQRRSLPIFSIRQMPCLAGFRTRFPGAWQAGGTVAFQIERDGETFRILRALAGSGNLDAAFADCIYRASPWAHVEYRGSPGDVERASKHSQLFLLWGMTWKLRKSYPPVLGSWVDPRAWELLGDGSYRVPPEWKTIASTTIGQLKPLPVVDAEVCSQVEGPRIMELYPALGEALYPSMFSQKAAEAFAKVRCAFKPRGRLAPPGGEEFNTIITVKGRVGHVDVAPGPWRDWERADLRACVQRKLGLPRESFPVPAQPDIDLAVSWPLKAGFFEETPR